MDQSWRRSNSLSASKGNDFWEGQQKIMEAMASSIDEDSPSQDDGTFDERRNAMLGDTVLFTILISSLLWIFSPNPFVAVSFVCGSSFGLAYSYGLGKYVGSLGGSAMDSEAVRGAGVGQARFAFLILLFIFVGKFRSFGFLEIPSIAGFFSYQLASLSQGLRDLSD